MPYDTDTDLDVTDAPAPVPVACADCGALPVWIWQVGDVGVMTMERVLCWECGRAWIEAMQADEAKATTA